MGKLDQTAVENWYAAWVSELIRITKPGKPIVVEQVSFPTCANKMDWGGVSKTWWKLAVAKYEWDVDEKSLVIKDLLPNRYNVFMVKNQTDSDKF